MVTRIIATIISFLSGAMVLKDTKHSKKFMQKVVTCTMAFIKMEDLCMTENDKKEIGKV